MSEKIINKINPKHFKSVKLFTHTDLDGVSCAILAGLHFEEICDVEMCDYNNINDKLIDFFNNSQKWRYDLIIITDISCNEEVAKIIDKHYTSNLLQIVLIDHHKTAEWLNKYDWANVIVEKDNHYLCSGTSLFAEFLNVSQNVEQNILSNYIELVRQYDTWEWKAKNNILAKNVNDLLYILGKERFINDMVTNITKGLYILSEQHQYLLDIEQEKKDLYFTKKEKELEAYIIDNMLFGVVFANEYVSELGNYLNTIYPNFKGIILVGEHGISYRTIHNDVDVSQIAKKFGGGGHKAAAGSSISDEAKRQYLNLLFAERMV